MNRFGVLALGLFAATWVQAGVITFDEFGLATSAFAGTNALREQYAGQGVHFLGSSGVNDGGGVLNDSSWNVKAFSGQNFLAFNAAAAGGFANGGSPFTNEIINFDVLQTLVSIELSGQDNNDTMRLTAFSGLNGGGVQIDQFTGTALAAGWALFSVTGVGIQSVVISPFDADRIFTADNLSFTSPVPEPASVGLIALGMLALVGARRLPMARSRQKEKM